MHASSVTTSAAGPLTARHVAFDDIPRADWDRLLAATPAATPFSRWTFHRAWWDAYGTTAHDEYLILCAPGDDAPRGIVPLMHRHEVEPEDASTKTVVREHSPRCQPVDGEAQAIMFGASYHADYATILAAPDALAAVAAATQRFLTDVSDRANSADGHQPWDVIDLRRLREVDPALPALESALGATREEEDVCPVVTVRGDTWDEYLATLDKTARHEIRRKLRRASALGEMSIEMGPPTPEAIEEFIRLHNLRFGDQGLFPDNEGGRRSLRFIRRLAELEMAEGDSRQMNVGLVSCGARVIFAGVGFDDAGTTYLYNAGLDPEMKDASPGITGAALLIQDRIYAGIRRIDFLRGNEKYKYEWGAVDEPIYRLLVRRESTA